MSDKNAALQVTQKALHVVSPVLGRLMEIAIGSANASADAVKNDDIVELRLEAERQELDMRMQERHAKVAQELALASRIETADEVEMEEFYDVSGSGSAGVNAAEESITLGINGQGKRVTKRIFRFKGRSEAGAIIK